LSEAREGRYISKTIQMFSRVPFPLNHTIQYTMCLKKNSIVLLLASVLSGSNIVSAQIATGTVIVNPTIIAGASYTTPPVAQGAGETTKYSTNNNCELISNIGSTFNLGMVTATVVVNDTAGSLNGEPYIGRYYDIHPSMNANQSATLTLYFSQTDFDAYDNKVAALGNALYPPVNLITPNLLITTYHGLPSSGTTGPNGEYDNNNKELITPASIVLNSAGFYEVTFITSGFSGFFARTTSGGTPLQITLGKIAAVNIGEHNRIDWNTLTETPGDKFEIERSRTGTSFENIGIIPASGHAPFNYQFTDENPFAGVNYYRLKLTSLNGVSEYSIIVAATVNGDNFSLSAYPNPVNDNLSLDINGAGPAAKVQLIDVTGNVIQQTEVQNGKTDIAMKHLAQGMYLIKFQDNNRNKTLKIYKN
jgi:hypothetical protein